MRSSSTRPSKTRPRPGRTTRDVDTRSLKTAISEHSPGQIDNHLTFRPALTREQYDVLEALIFSICDQVLARLEPYDRAGRAARARAQKGGRR